MSGWYRRVFQASSPVVSENEQITEPLTRGGLAKSVNFDQAMAISTWWACTRLLCETIAGMPLKCYEKNGEDSKITTTNRLWRMINYQPNRYQTRFEFIETLMLNLCANGNAYNEKQFDLSGRVVQLTPLMSGQMRTHLVEGEIFHRFLDSKGFEKWFPAEKIWHVKLFGNGIVGLSPLQYAAQTLGISIATRDRATKIANSGGKQNGILMFDKTLDKIQRQKIRDNLSELNSGSDDELFVLDKHMKYERTSLSPADMKLMELMDSSIEDICRFMMTPSVLVNHTKGTTAWGSGIAQIIEGFHKFGASPYLNRIEPSIVRWLLPRREWDKWEFKFDFDSLLRADLKTRFEAYAKGINSAVLRPNEARRKEKLPPDPKGEKLYLNGTLTPVGDVPARAIEDDQDNDDDDEVNEE